MRDASINLPRSRRTALHAGLAVLLLGVACALGGCAGNGGPGGAFALANEGPTVAFESIDGPPQQIFDRMVSALDSESKLRNLTIVSRDSTAAYRVRSYLSAQVVHGKTMIAWVWDVYDRDQERALRLSGQEAAGKAGREAARDPSRDPWAAADDVILRKIAQAGLSGLSAMINGTPDTAPTAPSPARQGPAVANAETAPSRGASLAALGYTDH